MLKMFNRFLLSVLLSVFSVFAVSCGSDSGGGGGEGNTDTPQYTVSFYDDGVILNQYGRTVVSGTQITLPTPTKLEHTFNGWLLNGVGSPLAGSYTVNANTTFVAKWTANNPSITEYTVSFYDNGVILPEYGTTVSSGTQVTLPTLTKANYTFNGWLLSGAGTPLTGQYTVSANTTFVAKWTSLSVTEYTVSFYDNGVILPEYGTAVSSGTQVTLPTLTKANYTFNGWLLSGAGTPLTGQYTVSANTIFVAQWTSLGVTEYTVSFYDNGVILPEYGITAVSGAQITLPTLTKANHTFDGWLKNNTGNPLIGSYTVTGNVNFYAKFTAIQYTVNYYDEASILISELSGPVNAGTDITLPNRSKPNYTFDGWLKNNTGNPLTGSYTVTGNVSFYAKFTAIQYTVNYYDEASVLISELSGPVNAGTDIALPNRSKPNYTFDGWLKNNTENPLIGSYTVTGNVNFYAKFTAIQYTVNYYDEASVLISELSGPVNAGTDIALPNRSKAHYTFDGWLKNNAGTPLKGTYVVTENVSFHAKFTLTQYRVSFYDENGQLYNDIGGSVSHGDIALPIKTRDGHTFDGWLKNNTGLPINGTYTVTENVSFRAKFTTLQYTVSYYDEIGQKYTDIGGTVNYGNIALPVRTKTGYTFEGWLLNGNPNPFTGTYAVDMDTIFHAKFTVDTPRTISFYDNGNLIPELSLTEEKGVQINLPIPPAKTDHTFKGWLLNGLGIPLTDSHTVMEDTVFIAEWMADTPEVTEYTVFFYDNGFIIPENSVTVESGTQITLPELTKTGYTFDGWLASFDELFADNRDLTGNETLTVTCDVYLHAQFTAISSVQYTVSYYDEAGGKYPDIGGSVNSGDVILLPPRARKNYTFDGWFDSNTGSPINKTYVVTSDVSFYAKWTLPNAVFITTAAELYNIRNNLSGKYILAKDISLNAYNSGSGWEPIANTSSKPFTGILDGNGYKITNLFVNSTGSNSVVAGLFGYIGSGSVINNLTLEVTSVKGTCSYVGALAGRIVGTADNRVVISNVHIGGTGAVQAVEASANDKISRSAGGISGSLDNAVLLGCSNSLGVSSSSHSYSGGIAGMIYGYDSIVTITNSYNTGDISSSDPESYSGGIVGRGSMSGVIDGVLTITNSYNTGNISSSSISGGIVGYGSHDALITITNCYNTGDISSSYRLSGGIVGNGGNVVITNCYNTGDISSSSSSGGIAGGVGGIITNCYNSGDISSSSSGGIAGSVSGIITNCYNSGDISSSSSGGIAGSVGGMTTITNCYNTGALSSSSSLSYSGGVIGYVSNSDTVTIIDCYNTGEFSSSSSSSYFGGVVGYVSDSDTVTITNCYNTGAFSSSSSSSSYSPSFYFGGIVGYISSNIITITNCYNTGAFSSSLSSSSSFYFGGIVGYVSYSDTVTITNCYNTGKLSLFSSSSSSSSSSGGVVGYILRSDTVMITNCYNTGDISSYPYSSSSHSGGVVGYISGSDTVMIANCYNSGDISSSSYSSSPFRSYSYSGGVVGYISGSDIITITDCYNTGDVSSSVFVSSYSYSYSGGIVGHVDSVSTTITIKNNAAMSAEIKVDGSSSNKYLGRIVGNLSSSNVTISNNFALDTMQAVGGTFDTSNPAIHGTSKTAAQLKTRSTYESAIYGNGFGGLGWQFGNDAEHPWKMPEGGGYPILYWQE
jgi:uncharacterized repeat protein (TIGR02543 family)